MWMMLGEEAFVHRIASSLMMDVANAEARFCQKHDMAAMPAIEALGEAQEIDASSSKVVAKRKGLGTI